MFIIIFHQAFSSNFIACGGLFLFGVYYFCLAFCEISHQIFYDYFYGVLIDSDMIKM